MEKTCSCCKRKLQSVAFNKNAAERDGLQRHCIDCRKAHYKTNSICVIAKVKAYAAERKPIKAGYDRNRRKAKSAEIAAYERSRAKSPERRSASIAWAKSNPERRLKIQQRSAKKLWVITYRRNKHIYIAAAAKRRARLLCATPSWYSELDDFVLREAVLLAGLREKFTGVKWDVDHIVPLKHKLACGLHVAHNLQVIPSAVNRSKNASNMQEYACGYGFL